MHDGNTQKITHYTIKNNRKQAGSTTSGSIFYPCQLNGHIVHIGQSISISMLKVETCNVGLEGTKKRL